MRPICILGPFLLTLPLFAQMHHVEKAQRVTRAVGVYEWTGDMLKPDAARLIPVSIFINNHYEDAGVFLAHPIPLALETGNVYAVQHSGDPIGSFDLDSARNIVDKRSTADDNTLGVWFGYGRFIPHSAAPPPHQHTQHSATPTAIVGSEDDSRPHFVPSRNPSDDTSTSTKTTKGSSSGSTSSTPDDPDRPQMHRRDSDSTATDNAPISAGTGPQGTAAESTGTIPDTDPDRPTLGHRNAPDKKKQKKEKESASGVEAMPTSLNDDPDRPEIHRGKVVSATAPPQLTGTPGNLHQAVAVSDAANSPIHVFNRDWETPIERAQTIAEIEKLAQPLVRQYLAANHLEPASAAASASSGPKPNTAPAAASKPATKSTHLHPTAQPPRSHHALCHAPRPLPCTAPRHPTFRSPSPTSRSPATPSAMAACRRSSTPLRWSPLSVPRCASPSSRSAFPPASSRSRSPPSPTKPISTESPGCVSLTPSTPMIPTAPACSSSCAPTTAASSPSTPSPRPRPSRPSSPASSNSIAAEPSPD